MESSSFNKWDIHNTFWEARQFVKGEGDKQKVIEFLHIGRSEFMDFLCYHGFYKMYVGTNVEFIRKDGAIIEKVKQVQIKDFVIEFISELPPYLPHAEKFTVEELREKLLKGVNIYFGSALMETLPTLELQPIRDTKEASYFFFKNCIAKVDSQEVVTSSYKEHDGHVWKDQIMDREFNNMPLDQIPDGFDFVRFLFNVSGADSERFNSLVSIVGYLLHTYKDPSRPYVVCLCDELVSDNPNGGTGKGLFIKAIKQMRNSVTVDGKGFKFDKSFLWQQLTLSTQIVALEDVNAKFNFENLFSVVTEGFTVEKKKKDEFHIPYEDAPKILITSNYALLGHGNSHARRKKEVEFAPYYTGDRTPIDEFGRMFFVDWKEYDWQCFDNFMLRCVTLYLSAGIKNPPTINLDYRKLKQETAEEFIDFMDNLAKNEIHNRKQCKIDFQQQYSDFEKLSQRKFNKWVGVYCEYLQLSMKTYRDGNNHLFEIEQNKD